LIARRGDEGEVPDPLKGLGIAVVPPQDQAPIDAVGELAAHGELSPAVERGGEPAPELLLVLHPEAARARVLVRERLEAPGVGVVCRHFLVRLPADHDADPGSERERRNRDGYAHDHALDEEADEREREHEEDEHPAEHRRPVPAEPRPRVPAATRSLGVSVGRHLNVVRRLRPVDLGDHLAEPARDVGLRLSAQRGARLELWHRGGRLAHGIGDGGRGAAQPVELVGVPAVLPELGDDPAALDGHPRPFGGLGQRLDKPGRERPRHRGRVLPDEQVPGEAVAQRRGQVDALRERSVRRVALEVDLEPGLVAMLVADQVARHAQRLRDVGDDRGETERDVVAVL
jgi:hypothetical protein